MTLQLLPLVVLCFSPLLLPSSASDSSLGCSNVKNIYQENDCCGSDDNQSLDGSVGIPASDQAVGPTCGDAKTLFAQESCCAPTPNEVIYCDATNCTDVNSASSGTVLKCNATSPCACDGSYTLPQSTDGALLRIIQIGTPGALYMSAHLMLARSLPGAGSLHSTLHRFVLLVDSRSPNVFLLLLLYA